MFMDTDGSDKTARVRTLNMREYLVVIRDSFYLFCIETYVVPFI